MVCGFGPQSIAPSEQMLAVVLRYYLSLAGGFCSSIRIPVCGLAAQTSNKTEFCLSGRAWTPLICCYRIEPTQSCQTKRPLAMAFSCHSATLSHVFLLILLLVFIDMNASVANTNHQLFLTVCGTRPPKNELLALTNVGAALKPVADNITLYGFGVGIGGDTDPVYALSQCFSYLSPNDCQQCYDILGTPVSPCVSKNRARVYRDGCFLGLADYNFFDVAVDSLDTFRCSNTSAVTANSTLFKHNVNELMTDLTLGAGKSSGHYMVGSTVASPGVTVYGMAQCWRTLNASGCRDCLESGRVSLVRCPPASDGKAFNAGCFLRYSTLPFYLESGGRDKSSAKRRRLIIVLGSVLGALGVVGTGAAFFWMRRRVNNNASTDGQEDCAAIIKSIAVSSLGFKYEDLKKATEDFSDNNKLGQGGYGTVYKGVLPDGKVVAVKRLFFDTRQRAGQFFNEVNLVNQVQHKNLVKLLGCSIEGPESLLVYEYLCNISLEKFLYDSFQRNVLDYGKRYEIIVGTAEGLAYLHNSSKIRIIHRDIKASNILLDEKFKPKIADFGLARFFGEDQTHISTGLAGTFGYMAPEYIIHGQLTEKADTYSYGILVIEIITGRKITDTASTDGHSLMFLVWKHFCSKSLNEILDDQIKEQCLEEEALKLCHVGLLCTQASPILRPPMWKVVEMLTGVSTDLPPPTVPAFVTIMVLDSETDDSHASRNYLSTSTVYGR